TVATNITPGLPPRSPDEFPRCDLSTWSGLGTASNQRLAPRNHLVAAVASDQPQSSPGGALAGLSDDPKFREARESRGLVRDPTFPQWTAVFPCSSREGHVPARQVVLVIENSYFCCVQ